MNPWWRSIIKYDCSTQWNKLYILHNYGLGLTSMNTYSRVRFKSPRKNAGNRCCWNEKNCHLQDSVLQHFSGTGQWLIWICEGDFLTNVIPKLTIWITSGITQPDFWVQMFLIQRAVPHFYLGPQVTEKRIFHSLQRHLQPQLTSNPRSIRMFK
jgi:hypothetical protein